MVAVMVALAAGLMPVIAGRAWGGGPEWVEVDTIPDHSTFAYDKSAVVRPAPGMVGVMIRMIYMPAGKEEALELMGNAKRYEGLAVSFFSYDIDCKGEKSRLTRVVHRDGKGDVIAEFDLTGKTDWEEIPAASRLDMIREVECK
ncbi:MAG: hypothetical protein CXR31_14505 [Geobacter sp.]|nr:MAG: hypothetical protein CXR31_14505 [Geobacter sp.]